ncbi:hypothetical protein DFQ28_008195 [Apophysomyces sp. BC1034]|nr:hypothetical protein DFQ28_008195 [Apophysomyces sp. BC1034]
MDGDRVVIACYDALWRLDMTGITSPPPHFIGKPSSFIGRGHEPVEQLLLRRNDITSLQIYAKTLAGMKRQLRELSLRDNLFNQFPKEILVLKNLTSLSFANNLFHEIPPNTLSQLPVLQWLSLAHNKLKDLPQDLEQCRYLRGIDMENNWLSNIPSVIYRLEMLDTLLLLNNTIVQMGASPLPPRIRILNLAYNRLTEFPSTLVWHPPPILTYLNLSGNLLGYVPTEFLCTGYEDLTSLDLHTCALKEIPAAFFRSLSMRCRNLKRLNLAINGLIELPPEIGMLQSVQWLNLNDNDIESLPATFSKLTNLVKLGMVENRLRELPVHIFYHLRKMNKLDLRRNQLRYLPPSIISLAPMREVDENYDLAVPRTVFPAYLSPASKLSVGNTQPQGGVLRTLIIRENKCMEFTDGIYCEVQAEEGVVDIQIIDTENLLRHLEIPSTQRNALLSKVLFQSNKGKDSHDMELHQRACAVLTQIPSLRELALRIFLNDRYQAWLPQTEENDSNGRQYSRRLDMYPDLRENFLDGTVPETMPMILRYELYRTAQQCDGCSGWYTYSPVKVGYLSRLCENRTVVPIRATMCSTECALDCMLRINTAKLHWRADSDNPAADLAPRFLLSEWSMPSYPEMALQNESLQHHEREQLMNISLPEACIVSHSLRTDLKASKFRTLAREFRHHMDKIATALIPGREQRNYRNCAEYFCSAPSPTPVRPPHGDRPVYTSVTSRLVDHSHQHQHYQILQPLPAAPSPSSFNHLPRDAVRLQRF